MPRCVGALAVETVLVGRSAKAPQAAITVAIGDHRVSRRGTSSFFPDNSPGYGALVVLGHVVGSVKNLDIDTREELSDVRDDLESLDGELSGARVVGVPGPSEFSSGVGIRVAFLVHLRISIDDVGSRRVGFDLHDEDVVSPGVMGLPENSPHVGVFLKGSYRGSTTPSERVNNPSAIGVEDEARSVNDIKGVLEQGIGFSSGSGLNWTWEGSNQTSAQRMDAVFTGNLSNAVAASGGSLVEGRNSRSIPIGMASEPEDLLTRAKEGMIPGGNSPHIVRPRGRREAPCRIVNDSPSPQRVVIVDFVAVNLVVTHVTAFSIRFASDGLNTPLDVSVIKEDKTSTAASSGELVAQGDGIKRLAD